MSATNAQQTMLSESAGFQSQVRASWMKKALAIIETPGSYPASAVARAKSLVQGQGVQSYYAAVASCGAILGSTVTFDFVNRQAVSDITEAALDAAVYATIFIDLA